jgi:hypothetical protein
MTSYEATWQDRARQQAIDEFRIAWERAPAEGRDLLVEAAARSSAGHRWETGSRACVLALLVKPARRPNEQPKAAAYRLFGCEVTDDFPATWDAHGVTLTELLASVGVHIDAPKRSGVFGRLRGHGAMA